MEVLLVSPPFGEKGQESKWLLMVRFREFARERDALRKEGRDAS